MNEAANSKIVYGKAIQVDFVPSSAVLPSNTLRFLTSRDGKVQVLARQEMQPVEGVFQVKYREGKEPLYSLKLTFKKSRATVWLKASTKLIEEGLCTDDGKELHLTAQYAAYEPNSNPDFEGHFLTKIEKKTK